MDPSDRSAAFRESIGGGRSRLQVTLVIGVAALMVGVGLLTNLTSDGESEAPSTLPATSAPAAAATFRPTLRPTAMPSPVPTLAPVVAPVTTAWLSSTGVLVADTGGPAVGDLVAAVNGTIWATRAGGIVNVDPQTGHAREWTLADDPAFATAGLAAARDGGVWLVGPEAIRRFDGVRFRAVIDTPGPVWSVAEGADGTLWAQTEQYGLVRWADGAWESDPPGRPGRGAEAIVVDADGRVWTANVDQPQDGWNQTARGISAWDGSAWASFSPDELPGMRDVPSLHTSGDGSMWAAVDARLARFQAGHWTEYEVPGLLGDVSLTAVGDDGRLWFVREDCGPDPCGVEIQVYDGSTLTTYDVEDGLPGPDDVGWPWASVLPGPGYIVASTDAGLYRLTDGSWQRLELTPPLGSPGPGLGPSGGVAALAALSHEVVWAAGESHDQWSGAPQGGGLFLFDGAAWHRAPLLVDDSAVGQAVVASDGALWVATGSGPLVRRRDGSWIDVRDEVAGVVPEPGQDSAYCGGAVFVGGDGVAYYAGPGSASQVVALEPVGKTWEPSVHPALPAGAECPTSMAATADGTIWVLERGWGNSLSRYTGGAWEVVSLPPLAQPGAEVNPTAIVVDRDGSLWVAAETWDEASFTSRADILQLVDGRWVRRGGDEDMAISSLAMTPGGSLIAVGTGVATFDGQQWHRSWRGLWLYGVSVAPDGAVWVHDGTNVYRLPAPLP